MCTSTTRRLGSQCCALGHGCAPRDEASWVATLVKYDQTVTFLVCAFPTALFDYCRPSCIVRGWDIAERISRGHRIVSQVKEFIAAFVAHLSPSHMNRYQTSIIYWREALSILLWYVTYGLRSRAGGWWNKFKFVDPLWSLVASPSVLMFGPDLSDKCNWTRR